MLSSARREISWEAVKAYFQAFLNMPIENAFRKTILIRAPHIDNAIQTVIEGLEALMSDGGIAKTLSVQEEAALVKLGMHLPYCCLSEKYEECPEFIMHFETLLNNLCGAWDGCSERLNEVSRALIYLVEHYRCTSALVVMAHTVLEQWDKVNGLAPLTLQISRKYIKAFETE